MKREILFRGKIPNSGKWIEGYLYQENGLSWILSSRFKTPDCSCEVISESVGQFTGLTDKNGNKIFEGDIINDYDLGLGVVIFVKCCFMIEWDDCDCYIDLLAWYDFNRCLERHINRIEVIENIHDNKDLLT